MRTHAHTYIHITSITGMRENVSGPSFIATTSQIFVYGHTVKNGISQK